ncbi:hypothetical protein PUNSTDRAFT_38965, partial [Punctularia strigosozonata HHB-11173 SS5]|uniref:uncharacterized protein n=1 Tax=Punctularia strigosozonata (strain HHB-11173) TaxID=741275 RepID=UPI00044177BD
PASLIPLDAPIQPRTYLTPSVTSRKDVPLTFAKKRARFDSVEVEEEGDLELDAQDLSAIEAKRRQNTLAARRSRRRKAEYQQALERSVEHWKGRALLYESMLEQRGV